MHVTGNRGERFFLSPGSRLDFLALIPSNPARGWRHGEAAGGLAGVWSSQTGCVIDYGQLNQWQQTTSTRTHTLTRGEGKKSSSQKCFSFVIHHLDLWLWDMRYNTKREMSWYAHFTRFTLLYHGRRWWPLNILSLDKPWPVSICNFVLHVIRLETQCSMKHWLPLWISWLVFVLLAVLAWWP